MCSTHTIIFFVIIISLGLPNCKLKRNSIIDEMDFSENVSDLPEFVLLVNLVRYIANSSSVKSGPIGFERRESY